MDAKKGIMLEISPQQEKKYARRASTQLASIEWCATSQEFWSLE